MPISFNQIPANALVPFNFVEFDGSRAVTPTGTFRSLLIGQRLASGNVSANSPVQINSVAAAEIAFGANSMLAFMASRFRQNSPLAEMWCVALDDVAAGSAADAEIQVTSAATARGEVALYIAGRRVAVPLAGGESVNATAAAINAAITAQVATLPATSAVANDTVTITHRHLGPIDMDVRFNYQNTDIFPAGFAATITATAGTGTQPTADIDAALATVQEEKFDLIAHDYTDPTSVAAIEAALETRWGPATQFGGLAIGSYRSANATPAEATTYGNARNSRFACTIGHQSSPTPTYEMASAVIGAVHQPAANDPARPFQTLQVHGVLPPEAGEQWNTAARNTVLGDGIATYRVGAGGIVRIERLVTNYQESPAGTPDAAFRDANTPLTLQYLRTDWRQYFGGKYGRHKLADDGTRFDDGQPIMTPSLGRAEAIGRARQWESAGLIENADAFKEGLVVVRNATDRNRLDFLMTPDLVNQLRVTGVQIAFAL